jgi:3-deoxy-D-manno-octulosonic-acid transferase
MSLADRLYGIVGAAVAPSIWLAARLAGVDSTALRQRRGFLPHTSSPVWWFHGASAGELAAALRLARLLRQNDYVFRAAFTSTNQAGLDFIRHNAIEGDVAALVPWDTPRWVDRALDTWKPSALFLIETELWPRLILAAHRRRIPVFCASARIYARDVWRYRLLRPLMQPTLRRVTAVLAQDEIERQRFLSIGAPAERCFTLGNLKHADFPSMSKTRDGDGLPSARIRWEHQMRCEGTPAPSAAQAGLEDDGRAVIFGSLHGDEVDLVADAIAGAIALEVRVVIAPRHPADAQHMLEALRGRGWRCARRLDRAARSDWQILLLDSMGELSTAYRGAIVAVIGGGWRRHGGHNPFEALAAGTPVLVGPHSAHFEAEQELLRQHSPEAVLQSSTTLAAVLHRCLVNPAQRDDMLRRQQRALPDGEAIAQRYMLAISTHLEGLRR